MSKQDILSNAGKISSELAQKKAFTEYESYKTKTKDELSEVEKQFIESIEKANKTLKALNKKKK